MKLLTFSRFFPKGHPRYGDETFFVEQILNSIHAGKQYNLLRRLPPEVLEIVNDFFIMDGSRMKHHTIRSGVRFSPGDMVGLRVWSGLPYRSKQIEFAQVEIKKTYTIKIVFEPYHKAVFYLEGKEIPTAMVSTIAENDGLTEVDFLDWFKIHPKGKGFVFEGQVISWNDKIDYKL